MALNSLQLTVLRLLAERRKQAGESYVAGGVALNYLLQAPRISRDVDPFHDTDAALSESFREDRNILQHAGLAVEVNRESKAFVEATVFDQELRLLIQWVRDSAYRFFPLIEDELLGMTMHPLDLATNKILALVGRLEPRDWIDTISCHTKLQRLGYLIWAACGKDEGYGPGLILDGASRQRYNQTDLDLLDFEGARPTALLLGRAFKEAIAEAKVILDALPEEEIGCCLLKPDGTPYSEPPARLVSDLSLGNVIRFHKGGIGGVWPVIVG
jgi:hypothetical protein